MSYTNRLLQWLVDTVLVICCAGMACATNYNPLTDWVNYPGAPAAWSYGSRLQTNWGSGVLGGFSPMIHIPDLWTSAPAGDAWAGSVSAPHYTLSIWKNEPWRGHTVAMMVWDNYSPVARLTPEAGVYDITGDFIGTGYAAGPGMTDVYIIKNGSEELWQGLIVDYVNPANFALTDVPLQTGDYIEFIAANHSGTPECRAALTADVTFVSNLSECTVMLSADLNHDCVVNLEDFAVLGLQWLISTGYDDLDTLSRQWLECTRTSDPDCWSHIESAMASQWIEQAFTGANPQPPFSFIYNGVSSDVFLSSWNYSRTEKVLDANRTEWTLKYTHPATGLVVTCEAIEYKDYPATEWVMYFENTSTVNTPIIEDVQVLDIDLNSPGNPQGGATSGAAWDVESDWGTAPPNPNGEWTYYSGWVAGWVPLNQYDNTAYPSLQRWSRNNSTPWVAKNTSASAIIIEGASVQPGQFVMAPGQGLGNCPAVGWKCPKTSVYNITVTLRNIGSGGDGISWNVHDGKWTILGGGDIANQGTASFTMTNEPVSEDEIYFLTFHSRGNTTGDLTLVDFVVTDVWPQWSGDFMLYHAHGSNPGPADFQPTQWCLGPDTHICLSPSMGRSTDGIAVPFFAVEQPDNCGRILGIGWSGQWAASFLRGSNRNLNIQAGMELTHLKLLPGEKIRTPSMVQFFWAGDRYYAQNQFRRFMLEHCSPRNAAIEYDNLNRDTDCSSVDNGTWSYGWGQNLSDFTLMDYQEYNSAGWYRDARNNAGGSVPPHIWYNKQGPFLYYGVPQNYHSMHSPSENSLAEWTKLRYTANQNLGFITFEGIIGRGDGTATKGKVDAKFVKNAGQPDQSTLWEVFDAGDNEHFSIDTTLNLDDTVDLLVGRGSDGVDFDNTNVIITVHSVEVPVDPPVSVSPLLNPWTETTLLQFINDAGTNNLPVNYVWMDAGWYESGGNWVNTGTWEVDSNPFPNGLEPVTQAIHNNGFKYLLWFEPERVTPNTWLSNNHQEWLLGYAGGWQLLNMGNPEALAWAKSKFSGMVDQWHVDCYRHDFNHFPLSYWRNNDASDRQGITEIRYITGLYEYFDTLCWDHPRLILDNCASGGKRLDFEMWRRSLALWRSDYCWDSNREQCFNYGLSQWAPNTGRGSTSLGTYHFRSGMGSHFTVADWITPSYWTSATERLNELHAVRHLFTGDFYPLTDYDLSDNAWMAWQYDRPEIGEGLVQAFRRSNNTTAGMIFKLKGLEENATYTINNFDVAGTTTATGSDLMENGLQIILTTAPGSAVITYSKN